MRGRFNRSGRSGVSFFAFQDVITAVTGILVIITVFLSLNIREGSALPSPSNEEEFPELKARLEELLQTITSRRLLAEAASEESTAAPKSIENEIAMLEKEAAELAAFMAARTPSPDNKPQSGLEEAIAQDVALDLLDARLLNAKSQQLRANEAKSFAARSKAEAEVKRREAELLAEIQQKNRLQLIRDRTRGSKEPVIAVIDDSGARLQRFDTASVERCQGLSEFRSLVSKLSSLEIYFVFYTKPSGATVINDYLKAARTAGFEVGYDAVPEDFVLELETTQKGDK